MNLGRRPRVSSSEVSAPTKSSPHDLARGDRRGDGLVDSIVVGAELGHPDNGCEIVKHWIADRDQPVTDFEGPTAGVVRPIWMLI